MSHWVQYLNISKNHDQDIQKEYFQEKIKKINHLQYIQARKMKISS